MIGSKLKPSNQAWLLLTCFVLMLFCVSVQAKPLMIDDTELSLQITPSSTPAKARVLWLVSEYGVLTAENQLAKQLANHGIESWQLDLFEALLLSPTASAIDEIPSALLVSLIDQAHQDGLPLFIIASNKAVQLAARGLHLYQQIPKENIALILLNPNLYIETPSPGEAPIYWPQTQTLNLPIFTLQAELSPWRWQLSELKKQLSNAGSPCFYSYYPKCETVFTFVQMPLR